MIRTKWLLALVPVVWMASAVVVVAQDQTQEQPQAKDEAAKAKVDPTGTWKWDREFGEVTMHFTLRLKLQDGTLTGRNKRSVWNVATAPYSGAHFATFPPALIEPCILAGCPAGGTVLDPFGGAGTTGLVADRLGRDAILIELNPEYADMARRRIKGDAPLFAEVQ